MENLEVKDVVELAAEVGQSTKVKSGLLFVAGIAAGIIVPKVLRWAGSKVAEIRAKVQAKRLAKLESKKQQEEQE